MKFRIITYILILRNKFFNKFYGRIKIMFIFFKKNIIMYDLFEKNVSKII